MDDLFLLGRVIFGGFFTYSGAHHLLATAQMAQYAAAKGVPMPEVAVLASGLLILAGGLFVIFGLQPYVGAACIALFLICVTPVMHNFWSAPDAASRASDLVNFTKNVALLGSSLALFGVPRPWPYSIERRMRIIA
jgi:putative oxidoreductase